MFSNSQFETSLISYNPYLNEFTKILNKKCF